MGTQNVGKSRESVHVRNFERALLQDLYALERMLDEGRFETGVRRIGAEQELVLVDGKQQPALVGPEVLPTVEDARVVPELARWNLEVNLSPRLFGGTCLSEMEQELSELVHLVRHKAHPFGADVLLTGILPTLQQSHLSMQNMTPNPRYFEMNDAVNRMRGSEYHISLKGIDELEARHDNIMLESCNTSFQVHFQVAPEEFAKLYNLAQAVSAPVLAAAVNSPTLFQRRLWQETRLAVFQMAVDTRSRHHHTRHQPARVTFGDAWIDDSILEIHREDIARFRVMLHAEAEEDPMKVLEQGGTPKLSALCLHNSTVWRWNRACYGVTSSNGLPHLRIENRVLPSGPTTRDAIANAAFFFGLMASLGNKYDRIERVMEFDDAKSNFMAAAHHGLNAQFAWLGGTQPTASELILKELIPAAREGLINVGVDAGDAQLYLGVIEERVQSGQTGSAWMLKQLAKLDLSPELRYRTLTKAIQVRQFSGKCVHEWDEVRGDELGDFTPRYHTVSQFMSTDLYTARPNDLVDMVAHLMDWKRLRYVLVEEEDGTLVGVVSQRGLLRLLAKGKRQEEVLVKDVMRADPIRITPETLTLEALELTRERKIGCLPVVDGNGQAIGVVTTQEMLDVATELLEQQLQAPVKPFVSSRQRVSVKAEVAKQDESGTETE